MPNKIPFDSQYTPPWRIAPCEDFPDQLCIVDTKGAAVAIGLSQSMAEDWLKQLNEKGYIEHDD